MQSAYTTHLDLAEQALKRGALEAALADLKRALALIPERPEAYHLLGVVRERYGDFHLALKFYRIALTLAPTYEPSARSLERLCTPPWHRRRPVLEK